FGEVLSEVVRGSHLDSLPIRHHSFYSRGVDCSLELLTLSLLTHKNRYRDLIFNESSVNVEDCHDLLFGLLFSSMHGVSFLPEELRRADERLSRSNLSAQDRIPDV